MWKYSVQDLHKYLPSLSVALFVQSSIVISLGELKQVELSQGDFLCLVFHNICLVCLAYLRQPHIPPVRRDQVSQPDPPSHVRHQ